MGCFNRVVPPTMRSSSVWPTISTWRFSAPGSAMMAANSRSNGTASGFRSALPESNSTFGPNLLTPVSGSKSKSGYFAANSSNRLVAEGDSGLSPRPTSRSRPM